MFLKMYISEHGNRQLTGADEKTFRKWAWMAVRAIADLRIVRALFLFCPARRPIESPLLERFNTKFLFCVLLYSRAL